MKPNEAVQLNDAQNVTERGQYPPPSKRKRNPVQQAADLTIKTLIRQGLSIRQTAAALHVSPSTVQRVRDELTNTPGLTNGLVSDEADQYARETVLNFLKQGAKLKKIKGSDVNGALKIYSDRRWPQKQDQAPASISFTTINIGKFAPSNPLNQEIDVSPADNPRHNDTGNGGETYTIENKEE